MNIDEISDTSGLRRVFAKANFDVDRFVRNTTRDGIQSTESMVEKLSRMSDDASSKMKRAVFDNYKLFIKAGKAASQLEATMHEINSDFTEQERVLNALVEMSLFGEPIPEPVNVEKELLVKKSSEEASAPKLSEFAGSSVTVLTDLVEGAVSLFGDPNRRIILDGELRELSMESYSLICVARIFLLTDMLVVAYLQSGRTVTHPYRIQAAYPLENVVAANVPARDRRHTPANAFKLLVYPASRLFQTETPNEKQQWLRVIEEATRSHVSQKKNRDAATAQGQAENKGNSHWSNESFVRVSKVSNSASDTMSVISISQPGKLPAYAVPPSAVTVDAARETLKALTATLPECAGLFSPLNEEQNAAPNRKNPFDKPSGGTTRSTDSDAVSSVAIAKGPRDWLWDVPEDLDVAISERDFARATELVVKAREEIDKILLSYDANAGNSKTTTASQRASAPKQSDEAFSVDSKPRTAWETLSNRIAKNRECLAEALEHELITAAERHGAPRAINAAVSQLGTLGKGTLAAQIFLVYRSNVMARALTRGVRQEGNQLVYLNRLSFAFHRNLAETAAEWQKNVVAPLTSQSNSAAKGDSKSSKMTEQLLALRFSSWALEETDKFSQQLRVLLIDSRSVSFYTTALAAQRIQAHANKITELIGVDIHSVLRLGLVRALRRAAEDQAMVLRDAVDHRSKQETWNPVNNLPAAEQDTYLQELSEMGLINKRSDLLGLPLTVSTCQLIRSLYHFVQSGRRLDCYELAPTLGHCMALILRVQRNHFAQALKDPKLSSKRSFILLNIEFLVEQALPKLIKQLNCLEQRELREVTEQLTALLEQNAR